MEKSGIFNMEPYKQLEKEYAKFTHAKHAVSVSSGTAALHLTLAALNIGPGDEVIVPDFTMAAVAFAVSYTGATPVFADVDPKTYAITETEIIRNLTAKTKAVIVVHTYGRLADMESILALAKRVKISVVEDACEAQGAVRGSKADLTCYSFYRNKIICAEEGGMITTDSKRHAARIEYLKNMAFGPKHDYFHKAIGYNYRMSNAMARLALSSLEKYEVNQHTREYIESFYIRKLPTQPRDAVWFYEVAVKNGDEVLRKVKKARGAFKPLSSFPMYGGGRGQPNARKLSESLVLLPVADVSPAEVNKICKIIKLK